MAAANSLQIRSRIIADCTHHARFSTDTFNCNALSAANAGGNGTGISTQGEQSDFNEKHATGLHMGDKDLWGTMIGCQSACIVVLPAPATTRTGFEKLSSDKVIATLNAPSQANLTHDMLEETLCLHRVEILDQFEKFKTVVNTAERWALEHFDALVSSSLKQSRAQVEALQIKAQQLVAMCHIDHEHLENPSDPDVHLNVSTPAFNFCGIHVISETMRAIRLWCFSLADVPVTMGIVSVDAEVVRQQLTMLKGTKECFERALQKRLQECFLQNVENSAALPFEGRFAMEAQLCWNDADELRRNRFDLAVSPDGSLVAITEAKSHSVQLYNVLDGKRIARFGRFGRNPGHFVNPRCVRFTPEGTSVMIVDSGNSRIQEMTVLGKHVRCISGRNVNLPYLLDVNMDVFVVAAGDVMKSVSVFHRFSGDLMQSFKLCTNTPSRVLRCHMMNLMPDGNHVAVFDSALGCGAIYSLNGAIAQMIVTVSQHDSQQMCVLDSGQIILVDRSLEMVTSTPNHSGNRQSVVLVNRKVLPQWGYHETIVASTRNALYMFSPDGKVRVLL